MIIHITSVYEYNRAKACGLTTRYDLDTINASAAALNAAVAEYETVYAQAWALIKPEVEYPGWWAELKPAALALYFLLDSNNVPALDTRASNTEEYPVGKWDRIAAGYRTAIKRLHKAMSAVQPPQREAA